MNNLLQKDFWIVMVVIAQVAILKGG